MSLLCKVVVIFQQVKVMKGRFFKLFIEKLKSFLRYICCFDRNVWRRNVLRLYFLGEMHNILGYNALVY